MNKSDLLTRIYEQKKKLEKVSRESIVVIHPNLSEDSMSEKLEAMKELTEKLKGHRSLGDIDEKYVKSVLLSGSELNAVREAIKRHKNAKVRRSIARTSASWRKQENTFA